MIKQTNFRIDSKQANRFRQYCEGQGLSQAQGFERIMSLASSKKEATSELQYDLASLALLLAQDTVHCLTSQLESKDAIIINLMEQLKSLQTQLAAAEQRKDLEEIL